MGPASFHLHDRLKGQPLTVASCCPRHHLCSRIRAQRSSRKRSRIQRFRIGAREKKRNAQTDSKKPRRELRFFLVSSPALNLKEMAMNNPTAGLVIRAQWRNW
jgi:hypothetical protein